MENPKSRILQQVKNRLITELEPLDRVSVAAEDVLYRYIVNTCLRADETERPVDNDEGKVPVEIHL